MSYIALPAIAAAFAVAVEAVPSILQIDLASIQNGAIVTSDTGFERLDEWTSNRSDANSVTTVGILPEQWAAAPPRPTRHNSRDHLPLWLHAATLTRKVNSFVAMRDESDENMVIYVVPPFVAQENRLVLADNGQAIDMEQMAFAYLYSICSKIVVQSHGALSSVQIDELSRMATSAKVLAETVPASSGGFVQPELLVLISNTDGTDEAVSVALSPLNIAQAGSQHLLLVEASRESAQGTPIAALGNLDRTVQGMAVASTGSGRFGVSSLQGLGMSSSALVQSGSIAALRTPRASAAFGAFSAVTIAALGSSGERGEKVNLVNRFVNTLPAASAVTRSAGERAVGGLQPPVAIAGLDGASTVLAISDVDGGACSNQMVRYDGKYSIPQLKRQSKSVERAIAATDNQKLFLAGRERLLQFREKYGEKARRDVVDLASHAYQEDALIDAKKQPIHPLLLQELIVGARQAAKNLLAGLGPGSSSFESNMLADLKQKEHAAETALTTLRMQYRKELEAVVDGVVAAQIDKANTMGVPVEANEISSIDRDTLREVAGKLNADAFSWLVDERGESSSNAMLEAWPRIKEAGDRLKRRSDAAREAASLQIESQAKKLLRTSKLGAHSSDGRGGVAIVSSSLIESTTSAVMQTVREFVEGKCRDIDGGCVSNTLQNVEHAVSRMATELRSKIERAVGVEVRRRMLAAEQKAERHLSQVVEQSFDELISGEAVRQKLATSLNQAMVEAETAQRLYVDDLGFSSKSVDDRCKVWANSHEEAVQSHVKQYESMLQGAFEAADIQIETAFSGVGQTGFIPDFWTIDQVVTETRLLLRDKRMIAARFIESEALKTRVRAKIVEERPGVIVMRNTGLFWIVLIGSLVAPVVATALGIVAGGDSKRFGVLAVPVLLLIAWAAGGSAAPVLAPVFFSAGAAMAGALAAVLSEQNAASYAAAASGGVSLVLAIVLHSMNLFAYQA